MIMQPIRPRPRISERDFIDLATKTEYFNTPYIDGRVMSSLIKTAYYCGLKKAKLLALNIGDIIDKEGNIRSTILDNISVTDDIKAIFVEYFGYLKSGGYRRIKSAPLFPNKKKKRYGPRQLQYDLEKCMKGLADDIGLETIRQSGIIRYYEEMREEGRSTEECMQQTMRFSHCTARHVEGILKNKIIPAGKKKDPFWEHYSIIEDIEHGSIKPIDENIAVYKENIENDPKLSVKRKALLLTELDRVGNIQNS